MLNPGNPTLISPNLVSSPTFSEPNIYYVDNNLGSDSNPGTQAQPWKTIRKVNDEMANFKLGDSILFKRGNTWLLNNGGEAGFLNITTSGITVGAYGTGNDPAFDGSAMTDNNEMWEGEIIIGSVSNVTVQNLELKNAVKQQIGIGANNANSNHITIQNCIVHDNRTSGFMLMYVENDGAAGTVNNITIANNQIYNSMWNAMRITGGVTNVDIHGNTIHDIEHNGIDTYPTNYNNSNFQIYDNNIYNFGIGASGAGIYIPGTDDAEIFDNNIHDSLGTNDTYGVKVGAENGFVNKNVVVRSNQIWNINSPNSNTYGLWFDYCTNCGSFNNALYANTDTILDENNINLSIKNNLAYANVRDQNSMRNYDQDPQFVNAAAGDFHLQLSSPACIAGENGTYIGAFPCQ